MTTPASLTSPRSRSRSADYTSGFDDVYWVTMSQLIEWMKDPMPASQMPKGGQPSKGGAGHAGALPRPCCPHSMRTRPTSPCPTACSPSVAGGTCRGPAPPAAQPPLPAKGANVTLTLKGASMRALI